MSTFEIVLIVIGFSIFTGLASHNATKNRIKIINIQHFKIDDIVYTIHQGRIEQFLIKGFTLSQGKDYNDQEPIILEYSLHKDEWSGRTVTKKHNEIFYTKDELINNLKMEISKTKEQIKGEILEAFSKGKTIQSNHDGKGWKDYERQNQLDKPNLDYGDISNWRIKPD